MRCRNSENHNAATHSLISGRFAAPLLLALALPLGTASERSPHSTATESAQVTGALLAVRLLTRQEAPDVLTLEVIGDRLERPLLIRGRLQRALPSQFADYLLPIAVPPGRFSLKTLGDGKTLPIASLDIPFKVAASAPVYLGRLVVRISSDGRPSHDLALQDTFDDDTLAFRIAAPELRHADIRRDLLDLNEKKAPAQSDADVSVPVQKASPPAQKARTPVTLTWRAHGETQAPAPAPALQGNAAREALRQGELGVATLNSSTAQQLPEAARGAFARFLQLPMPRAFAITGAGAYGLASGRDAIDAALQQCKRQAGGMPCSLVAVDLTLVTALPRKPLLLD